MKVRVDQAGHDKHAVRVDPLRRRRGLRVEMLSDRDDGVADDQNISVNKLRLARIAGEDAAA